MSSRFVYVVAGILILSAAYGCYCQAPLIWDGAYQFDMTLAQQHPYVYKSRFHTFFLWYPTVWASHLTSNANVLQAIYGLPFLLAPAVGLLLAWWIVKDDAPHLIIWVIFGVAAATLPGQVFVINDSFFQLHLFWPLFVSVFVPLSWPKKLVLRMVGVLQFAHPLGAPLFLTAAVAAAVVAIFDKANRRRLLGRADIMLMLCILAVGKICLSSHVSEWIDPYAREEASWANAVVRWNASVRGAPLDGLLRMWAAALCVLLASLTWKRWRGVSAFLGLGAILLVAWGAFFWIYRAMGPAYNWGGAIDYRRWVGPLTIPFFAFAVIDQITRTSSGANDSDDESRVTCGASFGNWIAGPVGILLAVVFAIALGMQYTTWHQRATQLMSAVRASPTVIVSATDPAISRIVDRSPLAHWATGNYVSAMLGKSPDKLFLDADSEKIIRRKYIDPTTSEAERAAIGWEYYAAQPDAAPGPGGWFDFRVALRNAMKESRRLLRSHPKTM